MTSIALKYPVFAVENAGIPHAVSTSAKVSA